MNQEKAIELAVKGHNIFLTGKAGTGKTYTLNKIIEKLRANKKIVAATASTGIAATYINGRTVHSWSGIRAKNKMEIENLYRISRSPNGEAIRATDVLIIDEISMISDTIFDMLDEVCKFSRGNKYLPFGGLQVIVVGDFFQLPPVVPGTRQKHFCFNSNAWKKLELIPCYLDKIYRQNDPMFLEILNAIREGSLNANHYAILSSLKKNDIYKSIAINMFCTNANVDYMNDDQLDKINGPSMESLMTGDGEEYHLNKLVERCLAPPILKLKKGAKVMTLANAKDGSYVNGTLGEVVGMSRDLISIHVYKTEKTINVPKYTWKFEEFNSYLGRDVVIASITQFPIKMAWAITVHKSQGASFDYASMSLGDTFAYNMGYVAISRVISMEGLWLQNYRQEAFKIDPDVIEADKIFLKKSMEISGC